MAKDSPFDRALPSNIEAERSILGAILLDNQTINQAAEMLRRDDFFLDSHRRIYDKMLYLMEQGRAIDPITLQDVLRQSGDLDLIGGAAFIGALIDGVPRFSNILEYCQIVKGKSIVRKLITTSNQIMNRCFDAEDEPDVLLDEAERAILSIAEDRIRQGFVPISEVAHKQLQHIEEIAGREQLVTGISTGFRDLDYLTSGLQRGDLIIIAARPSMGKTAFCLNIAQNAAMRQQHHGNKAIVGIFSLEMSKEQLVQRMLCAQARIDAHRLRTGMLSKEDWRHLALGVSELAEAQIFLDDTPAISSLEMRAKIRRLKNEQRGLDMIIVDYLQLMSGKGRVESRQQEVSQISRELKAIAKEMNVPLIALSQLSRAVESRSDHRPQLSDLRESGCLAGESLVTMADTGERVPIKDLVGQVGFAVWALNEETWQLERAIVSNAFATGVKSVYRLTTKLGRTICATANHKFRTFAGWKRLDEVQPGDRLALPRHWRDLVVPSMQEVGITTRQMMASINTAYCGTGLYKQNVSRDRAARVAQAVHSESLMKLAESDVYWDQVVAIEPDGETEVFDLTVPGLHNFEAEGLIVHNSLEQDADLVMFIYRDEVYNPETEKQNVAEIIIGKQRNGPIGDVELVFLKQLTRFEDKYRE